MDIHAATKSATQGKVLPVYLVGGDERLLVTRCVEAVRAATVGGGAGRSLAEDHYDGKGLSAHTVLEACRTLPMMARKRLVIVRAVDQMASAEQEALIPYFTAPVPSAVLVLVALQLDARRRLALEAKKHDFLFVAKAPSEGELSAWIEDDAKRRGLTLEPGVVESLSLSIGPDLSGLADALERLQLYTSGRSVTAHDVDEVVTPVREVPAWDLADAIGARSLPTALSILHRLAAQRQHALPTLGMIARQVHQIARARALLSDPKRERGSLASLLKCPPHAAEKLAAQAKRWQADHLLRAMRILAATDAALKGAKRGDQRVLEECVIALCGGRGMGEGALSL